jgi:hypothetical protein
MKRIIIICEGETEQEFCKDVLYPYFLKRNILIEHPTIKKSGGGIVAWESLKKQINNHLIQDKQVFVTTLIDYYGLNGKLKFPKWEDALAIVDRNDRMTFLEEAMKELIDDNWRFRFIPYIQLHEFEGLLFSELNVFILQIPKNEIANYNELIQTINDNPNPELINDGKETAPSKRLMRIIKGYNKIVYGSLLAQEIGLEKIRNKCPRFNDWLNLLENV